MFCACCSLCWKHSSPRSSSSCHFLLTQVSAETSLSQSFLAFHAFSPPLSLTLPFYIFSPSCWFIYCQSLSCLTAPSGIMRSKKTRSIHSAGLGIKLGVKKCLLNEWVHGWRDGSWMVDAAKGANCAALSCNDICSRSVDWRYGMLMISSYLFASL